MFCRTVKGGTNIRVPDEAVAHVTPRVVAPLADAAGTAPDGTLLTTAPDLVGRAELTSAQELGDI